MINLIQSNIKCQSPYPGTQGGYEWHQTQKEDPCRLCIKGRKEWRKATNALDRIKRGRFYHFYTRHANTLPFREPMFYEPYPAGCADNCDYIFSCDGKGGCWCDESECDNNWRIKGDERPCPVCRYAWATRIDKTYLKEMKQREWVAKIPLLRQLLPDSHGCCYYAGTMRGVAHHNSLNSIDACDYCKPLKECFDLVLKASVIRLVG